MIHLHYFYRISENNLRWPVGKVGCLYSPNCREHLFSETQLPTRASQSRMKYLKRTRSLRVGSKIVEEWQSPDFLGMMQKIADIHG